MSHRAFKTVSDKLLEYAELAVTEFEHRGYRVSIERFEVSFPYTPTLLCRRQRITLIVEVFDKVLFDRVSNWVAYGRSSGQDTRLVVCVPRDSITPGDEERLRTQGAGLYVVSENKIVERITPNDLALNVQLPPRSDLSSRLRGLLGHAYDHFDRSNWREGFEEACQVFENEARRYLKTGCKDGRIILVTKKGPKVPTGSEIDKMTMGKLFEAYSQIQNQNHSDTIIGRILKTVNKDRIGVAHFKWKASTEKRLRSNVGRHMWALVNAMKEIDKNR